MNFVNCGTIGMKNQKDKQKKVINRNKLTISMK